MNEKLQYKNNNSILISIITGDSNLMELKKRRYEAIDRSRSW